MAHRSSVALLALNLVALAAGAAIKETVSDCSELMDAFDTLSGQFADATRPTTLSMTLTLNCSADWSGCTDTMMFAPSGPANSTKQPGVKITITSNCKKGENVTIPAASTFITIDTSNTSAKVDVTLEKFTVAGDALSFTASNNSKSTLTTMDLSTSRATNAIVANNLDRMSMTGGHFEGNRAAAIKSTNILRQLSVRRVGFDGYNDAAMVHDLPRDAKATMTNNRFTNAGSRTDYAILMRQAAGRININMGKTVIADQTASVPICITSPANVTKATVSVSGSVGITPTKSNRTLTPAGWPTSDNCTIAMFSAA